MATAAQRLGIDRHVKNTPSMTRQALIKCRRRYLKVAAAPCLVAIALIPAMALVMARWEARHSDWPSGLWPVTNVLAVVVCYAVFWFVSSYEHRAAARCGLCCPQCKKTFVGATSRVLSTGRCVHCKERMLDDVAA